MTKRKTLTEDDVVALMGTSNPNAESPKPEWNGDFVTFDGEGYDGKYVYLASSISATSYVYNADGLPTTDCLAFIIGIGKAKGARFNPVCGFCTEYDVEMILRDIPVEDYKKILTGEEIKYNQYLISYLRGYHLTVSVFTDQNDSKGNRIKKTVVINDVYSFFGTSFVNALSQWGFDDEKVKLIQMMKKKRHNFKATDIDSIRFYNHLELLYMKRLMKRVAQADKDFFKALSIPAEQNKHKWGSLGSRAKHLMMKSNLKEQTPAFTGPVVKQLEKDLVDYVGGTALYSIEKLNTLINHPFSASYYGGRSELTAVGKFDCPIYEYDINGAYLYALARLPKWTAKDLVRVENLDEQERIGMYKITWNLPLGLNLYPFPFRDLHDTVCFPASGIGWVMSPELIAALDIFGSENIEIHFGYVVDGTQGGGSGITILPEHKLSDLAKKIPVIAKIRKDSKANNDPASKYHKDLPNIIYGKLVQRVGNNPYLNMFSASFITSITKALIIKACSNKRVIQVATDGITSLDPLDVPVGNDLGQWKLKEFDEGIFFAPGIYYLNNTKNNEKAVKKYRGLNDDFDPNVGLEILHKPFSRSIDLDENLKRVITYKNAYKSKLSMFVTRLLSINCKSLEEKTYDFIDHYRFESFSLESKRLPDIDGFRLLNGEDHKFYDARGAEQTIGPAYRSLPFDMDMVRDDLNYDTKDVNEHEEDILAHNKTVGTVKKYYE